MRGGLAGEGFGQHLLGEDAAEVEEEVFKVGQGGAPSGAVRAVELVHQVLGDAFEVGTNFFDLGTPLFGTRHHETLSQLTANGSTDFLHSS